jgi:hypothetical protein
MTDHEVRPTLRVHYRSLMSSSNSDSNSDSDSSMNLPTSLSFLVRVPKKEI